MYDCVMEGKQVDGGPVPPAHEAPHGPGAANAVAFLLAQLGSHCAARFAGRLAPLNLTPAHAGILRLVATEPELNQRQLASRLGAMPSRVVAFVDELEERGLLIRQRRQGDRRSHTLELTEQGRSALGSLRQVATAHEADITGSLSPQEREQLAALLRRLADANALVPGVHPGYRQPAGRTRPPCGE